ncbi:MAG: hypothetical protein IAG13_01990 [Deltaproteobacteria bacterium]|nr:hypothetical protein [Nannocystaceae bacterium]
MLVVLLAATAGCSLFKELQDADSAEDSGSDTGDTDDTDDTTGTGDSGSGTGSDETSSACEIPEDDRCLDQDTLQTCDPDSGELTEYACADLCAGTPNFTCLIAASDGRHGCWCVEPGPQKVLSCTELEACLGDCSGASDTSCADQCFSRTSIEAIRTFGALVFCAHAGCDDDCRESPDACGTCIAQAIVSGAGACTLERSVCDQDMNDEPWWP